MAAPKARALAHNAVLRVHAHATEEEERVVSALRTLAGPEAEVQRSLVEGHHKNVIVVLEATLLKGDAGAFWTRLRATPLAPQFAAEAERRLDDEVNFYARFDKQRAFAGEVVLTQGDDAIHLRSKIAAHPAKKGPAVKLLRDFLLAEGSSRPPKA